MKIWHLSLWHSCCFDCCSTTTAVTAGKVLLRCKAPTDMTVALSHSDCMSFIIMFLSISFTLCRTAYLFHSVCTCVLFLCTISAQQVVMVSLDFVFCQFQKDNFHPNELRVNFVGSLRANKQAVSLAGMANLINFIYRHIK